MPPVLTNLIVSPGMVLKFNHSISRKIELMANIN